MTNIKVVGKFWTTVGLSFLVCVFLVFFNGWIYAKLGGYPFSILTYSVIIISMYLIVGSFIILPFRKFYDSSILSGLEFCIYICVLGAILGLVADDEKLTQSKLTLGKERLENSLDKINREITQLDYLHFQPIIEKSRIRLKELLQNLPNQNLEDSKVDVNEIYTITDTVPEYPFLKYRMLFSEYIERKENFEKVKRTANWFEENKSGIRAISISLILISVIFKGLILMLKYKTEEEREVERRRERQNIESST